MIPLKIRNGFVTNSSSSSFIIGKANDNTVTIDSAYQEIKEFYKQYYKSCSEMYSYVEEYYPDVFEVVTEKRGKYLHSKKSWDCTKIADTQLRLMFGLDHYEELPGVIDWINCETYKDYVNFWISKMEIGVHAPFYIRDFSCNDPYVPLDFSTQMIECSGDNGNGIESDILDWYFPNFEGAVYGCDRCSAQYYCKKDRSKECEPMAESFKRKGIPEDKVFLYVLGKICVCSECGYLPDYVVERLEEISEYSCNHMG